MSAEEVAEVLEKAHDELLVRGWSKGRGVDKEGRVCALVALGAALHPELSTDQILCRPFDNATEAAGIVLRDSVGCIPAWNDAPERTIDDVLDAFRHAAKRVRNGE